MAAKSVKKALDESLRKLEREEVDEAVVALAKRYAGQIDEDPSCLQKMGPMMLECLRDLRMTPKSRSSVMKGDSGDGSKSALDELRARREQRPSAVDSSSP